MLLSKPSTAEEDPLEDQEETHITLKVVIVLKSKTAKPYDWWRFSPHTKEVLTSVVEKISFRL